MSPTVPSNPSAPALYLSNWQDLVGIWMASELTQTDTRVRGPSLNELHYLGGPAPTWGVSQIVDYTGFFRDETASAQYDQPGQFSSEAWFESGDTDAGILTTRYHTYHGAALQPRCDIKRSYAAVPGQPFFVVRYSLTNKSNAEVEFNVLDQLHLANVALGNPSKNVHAWFDAGRNALVADMTASGQFFVVLGAFQAMDGHQVGDDTDSNPASVTCAGWHSFHLDGSLKNNGEINAGNVDLAFNKRLTISAGATQVLSFYLTVRGDLASALGAADLARSEPASHWFTQTATSYKAWLSGGGKARRVQFADTGLNTMFDRSLILIKNTQNPKLGTFAATTNPFAYGYKNWVRDGSITAIALDACGHHEEANSYWRWMAGAQAKDGSWKTTFDFWTGSYLSFVEPESDSLGAFLYGVYRHYLATADAAFLNALWPTVERTADWILLNISSENGLGGADFSIWEEPERGLEHNSFTQAWYVAGLYAAQCLAESRGDTDVADWLAGGAASIMTALQRPSSWFPPGLWNPNGYYNRGVDLGGAVQPLQDSSSNMLLALGVVDCDSERASRHIATMTSQLSHDGYGMARYRDDDYYFSSRFNPAGDEVKALEPSWPQMSMWVALYEIFTDQKPAALARLQWFVSRAGRGYMPQGEAISNITHQSVLSSMCEPLTASSFILAALRHQDEYEPRIAPPVYNAGTRKAIAVHAGTSGDWVEWSNVPYFRGALSANPAGAASAVKRVYAANDDQNIYLRVDNLAGSLPGFRAAPEFALRVYAADFAPAGAEIIRQGLDGAPIARGASFALERRSNEDVFRRWRVSGAVWTPCPPVTGVSAPQWEPASGRIEVVIPISAVATGVPAFGNAWAPLTVALARFNVTSGAWVDDGKLLLHYRLSVDGQAWIFGNIEQAT